MLGVKDTADPDMSITDSQGDADFRLRTTELYLKFNRKSLSFLGVTATLYSFYNSS